MKKLFFALTMFATSTQATPLQDAQRQLNMFYCRVILLDSEAAALPFKRQSVPFRADLNASLDEGYSGADCRKILAESSPNILGKIDRAHFEDQKCKDAKAAAERDGNKKPACKDDNAADLKNSLTNYLADRISQLDPLIYDNLMNDLATDYRKVPTDLFPMKPQVLWEAMATLSEKIKQRVQPELDASKAERENPKWATALWFTRSAGIAVGSTAGVYMGIKVLRGAAQSAIINGNWFSQPNFKEFAKEFWESISKRRFMKPRQSTGGSSSSQLMLSRPPVSTATQADQALSAMERAVKDKALTVLVPKGHWLLRGLDKASGTWKFVIGSEVAGGLLYTYKQWLIEHREDPYDYLAPVNSALILDDWNESAIQFLEHVETMQADLKARSLRGLSNSDLVDMKFRLIKAIEDGHRGADFLDSIHDSALKTGAYRELSNSRPEKAKNEVKKRFFACATAAGEVLAMVDEELADRPYSDIEALVKAKLPKVEPPST